MFAVLFEVQPRSERWDAYLSYAKGLRPELEKIDGFVDNIRYRSLTRDGWLLSLSSADDPLLIVSTPLPLRRPLLPHRGPRLHRILRAERLGPERLQLLALRRVDRRPANCS